jgi:replicative DNA helicase
MTISVQQLLLAGLAQGSTERWAYAMSQLTEDYFSDEAQKLFRLYQAMWRRTGAPLTGNSVRLMLANLQDEALKMALLRYVDQIDKMPPVSEQEWRFAVHYIQDLAHDRRFQDLLTTAMEINARGAIVKGRRLVGRESAVAYLLATLPDLVANPDMNIQDVAAHADEALEEYECSKAGKQKIQRTYIKSIDNEISGLEPGDLLAVLGFTGEGKTMLCGAISHNIVVHGGNVLYCTTETVPLRIKRRFICVHSMEPQFSRPLPYNQIKHGTLPPDMEEELKMVVKDLQQGRAEGRYGAFKVTTIQSLEDVRRAIKNTKRELGVLDFVVVDYLALAAKSSDRVALVDSIKQCKAMATGEGVPVATPWQTSIEAWQRAQKTGGYTKASMAETMEIERTADFVLTLLRDPDSQKLLCKFTKCRDEADNKPFELMIQPQFSYVGDMRGGLGSVIRL